MIVKKVLLIVFATTFSSCKDDNSSQFVNLDTSIELSIFSSDGSDLLNPTNTNGFNFDEFRVYYLRGDEKIEVYDPDLDLPRNLDLIEYPSEYRLRLFPIEPEEGQISSTTYIRWNDSDEDTIVSKYQSGENFLTVNEVVYNGSVVWNQIEDGNERYFSVVK